ncbi:MAG: bifunctional diaminohydroxyphosphoribosylaminopyrimidine deaminase/5-amino-6-(5-phosphoribosylamino)uracil reductase RibD, partial [Longimicrobiales bacterium]
MLRALELAELGWGRVQPNPLVGAVVVDASGQIVGEGHHQEYGGPHAEVLALRAAGASARASTLYVTLEPCAHHGQTPPCTEAILQAGIARVVYGARDPNPRAAGGASVLRAAGVTVSGPSAEALVQQQNRVFFHACQHARPFVTLKLAVSLDGRVATSRAERTPITGMEAQAEVHRQRAGHDAIMVGSGTALTDDPLLTVRGAITPRRPPLRIILDSQLRLPLTSQLVRTVPEAPLLVCCGTGAEPDRWRALENAGAEVTRVPEAGAGLDLNWVLSLLWERGIRSVYCEGGPRLAGALARAGRLDRFQIFIAPLLLGADAVNAFDALPSPDRLPL